MDLTTRYRRSQRAFVERFGAYTVQQGSVIASVTPSAPDRSLPNSIVYWDPADLIPALPELERVYRSEGINAWTVWVQPEDEELAGGLEATGHAFDGHPARMAARIDDLELSDTPASVVPVTEWRVVGEINDAAYDITGLAQTFGAYRGDDLTRGWLALDDDGAPVATASVLEWEGDAFVVFVATRPEARGAGLCRGLLSHALRVARDNGCTTTSLEGSRMGEPVYARMGYTTFGRLQMWERRISNDSA